MLGLKIIILDFMGQKIIDFFFIATVIAKIVEMKRKEIIFIDTYPFYSNKKTFKPILNYKIVRLFFIYVSDFKFQILFFWVNGSGFCMTGATNTA